MRKSVLFVLLASILILAGCSSEKDTGRIYVSPVQQETNNDAQQLSLIDEGDYSLGNENAPVIMIEFSDYECPFCREFALKTLPKIKEDYIDTGKVRLVFKDYPLVEFHPNSIVAAKSANCAGEQGKYWEMHDALFRKVESWNTDTPVEDLTKLADSIGLQKDAFIACTSTEGNLKEIQQDIEKGKAVGIRGTPTFIINSRKVEGSLSYSDYQTIIEQELSK